MHAHRWGPSQLLILLGVLLCLAPLAWLSVPVWLCVTGAVLVASGVVEAVTRESR